MSPDEIFAGLGDLDRPGYHGDYNLDRSSMKEVRARYYPDRHFEPVEEGVRSYVVPVRHPWHQSWAVDLIAWPAPTLGKRFEWIKARPDKWATRFKRAALFSTCRLAPAFNGGADPLFVYRTPNDLLRSEPAYAYGVVLLSTGADRDLDRVANLIAEDEEHARELRDRLGRPVRYLTESTLYIGDPGRNIPIDCWIKHYTATV
jgi:hypothetical protein